MAARPTYALIDDAITYLGTVEGFANTIAHRRTGTADYRLALVVAQNAKRSIRMLGQIEREEEDTDDASA